MGTMMSPVDDLEHLEFRPIPKKPAALRVVCVDGIIVAVGPGGALYTNAEPLCKSAHCVRKWHWSERVLAALSALGVISEAARDKHQRYLDQCQATDDAASAFSALRRAAEHPITGVTHAHIVAAWNAMDWWAQKQATRHSDPPEGCVYKSTPAIAACTQIA